MFSDDHSESSSRRLQDRKQPIFATSETLTPSEIQSLRQHKREMSDYLRKAFRQEKQEKAE